MATDLNASIEVAVRTYVELVVTTCRREIGPDLYRRADVFRRSCERWGRDVADHDPPLFFAYDMPPWRTCPHHPGWTFVVGPGFVAWREGRHKVHPRSDLKRFNVIKVEPRQAGEWLWEGNPVCLDARSRGRRWTGDHSQRLIGFAARNMNEGDVLDVVPRIAK